jgi:hypothetical protein
MWDWDHQSPTEVEAGWAAIDRIADEDGVAASALRAQYKNHDWTPRTAYSPTPARTGGLWALGSPEALADRIRNLQPLDYLLLATDEAMTKTLLRTNGVWEVVAQMGGGGTDAEILGAGRVEWVAAGAIQVIITSWDVKASSYLAESGAGRPPTRLQGSSELRHTSVVARDRPCTQMVAPGGRKMEHEVATRPRGASPPQPRGMVTGRLGERHRRYSCGSGVVD